MLFIKAHLKSSAPSQHPQIETTDNLCFPQNILERKKRKQAHLTPLVFLGEISLICACSQVQILW